MAPDPKTVYGAIGAAALLWPSSSNSKKAPPGTRAVFVVGQPVESAEINISQTVHDNITHEIRMSLEAVSHWGVLVIDDESGETFQWDLMSNETWKPFKIVIYRNTITQELAASGRILLRLGIRRRLMR
jgi:hypothetical protein